MMDNRPKRAGPTDLSHLATPGTCIAVRVTPRASRARLVVEDDTLRAYVTVVPEDGKANAAVQALLAKALGVAKSRLVLVRGQTSRDKLFEVT
jgi:uncharacterized protein YggU (UPF0235/DUF167 family)